MGRVGQPAPLLQKDNTPVKVKSIIVNNEEVVEKGRVVSIVLEEATYEKDGVERSVNNVINILPKTAGGGSKKKSGNRIELPE